jgi:hypothetical protein
LADISEKLLLFQCLGCQFEVLLEELHQYADGVPDWSSNCPPLCGHTPSDVASPDSDALSISDSMTSLDAFGEEEADVEEGEMEVYMEEGKSFMLQHALLRDQQWLLWHQHFAHLHSRCLSNMHRHADGVPKVPIATELDSCPVCATAKLQKAARGKESSHHATQCNQGVSIDFGFMVQKSSADSARVKRLQGLHGKTCYCLITNHYSGCLFGETFCSKAPPLDFL